MARIKYYNTETGWEYADESNYIAPVQSVNGKVGAVQLTPEDVGAEKSGLVSEHNQSTTAHEDIRALLANKIDVNKVSVKTVVLTLADGSHIEADVLVQSAGGTIPSYVNQLSISIDADGNVYDSDGWKGGVRLSASSGSEKTQNGAAVTGFMPVKSSDIVRFKYTGTDDVWEEVTLILGSCSIVYYDASFAWLGAITLQPSKYGICTDADAATGTAANGGIVSFNVPQNENIAYARLSVAVTEEDLSGLIVTVNEEIT